MQITLLGTGAAGGVPLFGCQCSVCSAAKSDPSLRRRPASALLEVEGAAYLIDAGIMDIGERFEASFLNAIFLTHFHPDHVQGLFHIRWGKEPNISVFCPPDKDGCADLYKHPGLLEFIHQKKYATLKLENLEVTSLPLIHSKLTYGYLFQCAGKSVAYFTDTKGLPPKVLGYLTSTDLEYLIIDTSSPPDVDNRNHNNLNETLALHDSIGPRKTIMTHIGHDFDRWLKQHGDKLPSDVIAGYDGMTLTL
ncbi:hypothetical protein A3715_20745 [Oleiphilus sp. HI0009]|nr:hypothetical protein A3715_02460 [Oleiphilus sp. HI0009]KZX77791.1 hypothetical protein A3715_20745 [Oleiphilus sp. HI0009]